MVVLVDAYLGKTSEEGWWRFRGRLEDHPEVMVPFIFSDQKQTKHMRQGLLEGKKTTCGTSEELVEEIAIV